MMLLQYNFLIFFIKTYAVGTRLNCLDLSRQFKQVPTTYVFYKEVDECTLTVI